MTKINAKLDNEKKITKAIEKWYKKHAYGPSYRDLSEMTEMSLGNVFSACQQLREAKVITFQDGVARTIKLLNK